MGKSLMLGILDMVGEMLMGLTSWFTETFITPVSQKIITAFFKAIIYACASFLYIITVFLLQILDFAQMLFRSLAGLPNKQLSFSMNGSVPNTDALMTFFRSDVVVNTFLSCCIAGVFLLIISTIFHIIKIEYTSEGAQNAKGPIIGKMFRGLCNLLLVPALTIFGIFIGNQVLNLIDTATGGGDDTTLGSVVFVAGASGSMWDEHGCPFLLQQYVYSQLAAAGASYGLNLPVSFAVLGVAETFGAPFLITDPLGDDNQAYRDSVETRFKSRDLQYNNIFHVFDYYNFFNINYILIIFSACLLLKTMFVVCFGLMDRLFTTVVLYIISPLIIGFSPIKDSTSVWRSAFIAKIMSAYGVIIGVNLVLILVKTFLNMQVFIDPAFAKKLWFSATEITALLQMFCVIAAFSTLEKIIADIGGYLGGGSALTDGMPMYGEIKKGVKATMTVIKIAVDVAITVASIAGTVGSMGAAAPAAGAAAANTVKGVATAGKGVAQVAKSASDAAKAARVAKQAGDAAKKSAKVLQKGKEIYGKVKKVTDNVSKVKNKADEIKSLFAKDKSGGEDIEEEDLVEEYNEAFEDIDDKDQFNQYSKDRKGFLSKFNNSQSLIDKFDGIIHNKQNYTADEIADATEKREDARKNQDAIAKEFADKYSDEDIDKYERGIAAQDALDTMRSAKSEAQEKHMEKKKLRRDKLMTTYNGLKEWGKSGLEDLIPAPLKDIASDWNSAKEKGNYTEESKQALQNVKEYETKKHAEAFEDDPINSRLIALNNRYQSQQISKLMIEKLEFHETNMNEQMGKLVTNFNSVVEKLNLEKAKQKKDQDMTKIQDWEQTLDYYKNEMREINSDIVIDGNIISNYKIKFDISGFKNSIQEAIKRNATKDEINSIISEQLKKWGQSYNEELIKELRKIMDGVKGDLGAK